MHGKLLINELCLKDPDVHCVYGTYLVTGIDSSRLGGPESQVAATLPLLLETSLGRSTLHHHDSIFTNELQDARCPQIIQPQ
jgi:hypothetical protein